MTYIRSRRISETVTTAETTTSTSFANLTTVGPDVSIRIGPSQNLWVSMSAQLSNNTQSAFAIVGFDVRDSGDTTTLIAADDTNCLSSEEPVVNERLQFGAAFALTGSGIFLPHDVVLVRMRYRVTAGTGTFGQRVLAVWTQ